MEETFETYGAAVDYINATPKFTTKNSMEDTARFWAQLGYPAKNSKNLHIAGTNGKGSVCAYLCSVLRKAGISCGMFTSPHLVSMRERFVINGEMVSEEDFLYAFRVVMGEVKRLATSYHPTFFELLFFMAMTLFEKYGVEYVVLETGLGGRLDATNVVEEKKLCVITSIGYDHMEYLGETLAQIAGEKAGIMRAGVPVVYPERQEDVTRVMEEYAKKIGAEIVPVGKAAITGIKRLIFLFIYTIMIILVLLCPLLHSIRWRTHRLRQPLWRFSGIAGSRHPLCRKGSERWSGKAEWRKSCRRCIWTAPTMWMGFTPFWRR